MSAFAAGWCAMAAICCGLDWLKYREGIHSFGFWVNLFLAVLNTFFWLTA